MTPIGQADTASWQKVGLNSSRSKSSGPIKKGRICKMARHDKLYTWMRYSMLLLCVMLVISGFVLLGLGAWIRYGAATFVDVLGPYSSQLIYISYICIGMGSVLSFTGLIGCCGVWKENRFFIMLFFFIVTMLFVAEIIGTIFVLMYRNLVRLVVRDASKNSLMTAYMGPAATDPISTAWNTVMVKFKCCGIEISTVDFKGSVFSTTTGLNYPKTCCVNKTLADCDGITITPSLIQPQAGQLIDKLGTKVVQNIRKDYGGNSDVTALWNVTMDTLKCCGFYNYTDFTDSPFEKYTHLYPQQCCHSADFSSCDGTSATIIGCFPKLMQLIDENTIVIVAVALGIAALETLAMVVSMTLYCIIGSKSD